MPRWRSNQDATHAWWYETTPPGTRIAASAMAAAGRPVPPRLGARLPDAGHFLVFLPLVRRAAARPDTCTLVEWRTKMQTSMWLRGYELTHLRADGSGTWVEGDRAVRFLLHIDRDLARRPSLVKHDTVEEDALVAPYRRGGSLPPAGVILLLLASPERERHLLADLVHNPLPVPTATSHAALLDEHSPAGAVWTVSGSTHQRRRLIDLVVGQSDGSPTISTD